MLEAPDYVIVNVSNMDRSVAFYREALGLPLKFASPGWSELATGRTTIALHAVEGKSPAPGPPVPGTAMLGFGVPDVDAAHAALVAKGVRFAMPPTDRREEGIRLAVALDPDGLQVGISQQLR